MGCKREIETVKNLRGSLVSTLREMCFELVDRLAFPDRNDENWKHTNLKNYLDIGKYLDSKSSLVSQYNYGKISYREKANSLEENHRISIVVKESGEIEVTGDVRGVRIQSVGDVDLDTIKWTLDDRIVRYSPDAILRGFWGVGIYVGFEADLFRETPVEVEVLNRFAGFDKTGFSWLVIDVGANNRVVLSESVESENPNVNLFSETDVSLGKGSSLDWINYSAGGVSFHRDRSVLVLGNDSSLNLYSLAGGRANFRGEVDVFIEGSNAEALMREAFISFGGSKKDIVTLQHHREGFSRSNLLVSGAIGSGSRGDFTGTIRVDRNAQKTDAYQKSKMMLLAEDAHAGSVPKLEILADDVKCSHGAGIGEVDDDTLFYLMSRGIDRKKAVVMALEGFFGDFVDRLPEVSLEGKIESSIRRDLKELVRP